MAKSILRSPPRDGPPVRRRDMAAALHTGDNTPHEQIRPSPRQRRTTPRAADPAASAFVAASAGSGKTKLLTDRLLRLMLSGVAPQRIQCLTFTKAAAAEMAVRLQNTLGDWVTLTDPALDTELTKLDLPPPTPCARKPARLFAEVLDLPGGMRIGTIHAFCQSLLRRFPLEHRSPPTSA